MNRDPFSHARRVAYLISGFVKNDLTETERAELDLWIASSDDNMRLFGKLTDEQHLAETKLWLGSLDEQSALEKFHSTVYQKKPGKKMRRVYWLAAASVLLLVGSVVTWSSLNNTPVELPAPKTAQAPSQTIAPGSNKATLTLQDGRVLDLRAPASKTISFDDNSQAVNDFSVLTYHTESDHPQVHVLNIPRGGEYQLILPDGTHAWLNAETTLSFPTAFASAERIVQLTGEAYFEVAPNPNKPFRVIVSNETTIEVLGTHFNVNAYAKSEKKISLLEGKIRVQRTSKLAELVPGQQLTVSDAMFRVAKKANIEASVAWTKGKFSFDHTPVVEVIQQIGRWYDTEVNYNGDTTHEFTGEVFRNSSLEQVLRMLELSTGEKFLIQGRTIVVQP